MIDLIKGDQSVRRVCDVLGLRRKTYYRRKQGYRPEEKDREVVDKLHEIVAWQVAWGFWMVYYYLRNQGYKWNHKRVYRIWKAEGLNLRKVPKRKKISRKYLGLMSPAYINQGWSIDFLSDWVVGEKGTRVRIINVIDDCSRKALWTEAYKRIPAKTLVEVLDNLIEVRGTPQYIRCDNGPEFISEELKLWADKHGVELRFIQPGKPSQNGLIERLNGTLRRECLNLEWFQDLEHINEKIQQWAHVYNNDRPHSSIGYKSPNEFERLRQNSYFRVVAA